MRRLVLAVRGLLVRCLEFHGEDEVEDNSALVATALYLEQREMLSERLLRLCLAGWKREDLVARLQAQVV